MPPTPTRPAARALHSKPRRVRLVLRDGAEVEGGIFLNDGQALAPYLGTRKGGWVNLVDARWLTPVEELVSHAVLQSDQVLYAYGVEGDVPVHSVHAAMVSPRAIEVTLTNGTRVSGDLAIANKQRLSDFLHTSGKFIPIVAARRSDTGAAVGDIALNNAAVRVLRDTGIVSRAAIESEFAGEGTPHAGIPRVGGAHAGTPHRGTPQQPERASLGTPRLTPESVHLSERASPVDADDLPIFEGPSAIAEEISRTRAERTTPCSSPLPVTPSASLVPPLPVPPPASLAPPLPGPPLPDPSPRREPSRPSLRLNLDDDSRPTVELVDDVDAPSHYSAAVMAVADRAAEHWLSRVAERFGLAPADPRRLGADFTIATLWAGIARANDLSVDEVAPHVATAFRLPVARLDATDAKASALLDEAIAREFSVCPLRGDERRLVVATADPSDSALVATLGARTGREIHLEIAAPSAVQGAIDWWYRPTA